MGISGNQYVMVAYHSSIIILVEPFYSIKDKNRLAAFNAIMQRLKEKISLLTYTSWTINVARITRQPFETGGKFSSNSPLLTCTGKIQQSKQFEHLKLTSSYIFSTPFVGSPPTADLNDTKPASTSHS